MTVSLGVILLILLIGGIAYGYYKDYKKDKNSVSAGLKTALTIIFTWISVIVITKVHDKYIPVYQNFGPEHNEERIKLGIPIIDGGWHEQQYWRSQYTQWYVNPNRDSLTGHHSKMIEFNFWSAIYEEDFYQNPNLSEYLVSKYIYSKSEVQYFLVTITTLDDLIPPINPEKINRSNGTTRTPITKARFDQILNSWKKSNALLEQEENN